MKPLTTRSLFYYIEAITVDNNKIDFNEGNGPLVAEVNVGRYSPTSAADALALALNTAGDLDYEVTFLRNSGKYKVSASGDFSLLIESGVNQNDSAFDIYGFSGPDAIGDSEYESSDVAAKILRPQFWLQNYIPADHHRGFARSTKHSAADGKFVQIFSFGDTAFYHFNITLINDYDHGKDAPIETDENAVESAEQFLLFAISGTPFEFMPDRDDKESFNEILLESTPDSDSGTEFRLQPMTGRGLFGYYETGRLVFRRTS